MRTPGVITRSGIIPRTTITPGPCAQEKIAGPGVIGADPGVVPGATGRTISRMAPPTSVAAPGLLVQVVVPQNGTRI